LAQSKAKPKQRATEQTPAVEVPEPRAKEKAAQDAKDREERAALERRLAEVTAELANFAVGLFYATIGLGVVTGGLWLLAYLQSRDIKAAVLAAQESSAAARMSAQVAERSLVLTQRATVIVHEPKAIWLRDGSEKLVGCRLFVTWHNVGSTPTRDMVAAVAGLALDKRPPLDYVIPKANARHQATTMGPNSIMSSGHINLPMGLIADILQRRKHYLFCGWADYNDVFPNTPRRRAEFCYRLDFEGDLETQHIQAAFHIHGERNCQREIDAEPNGNAGEAEEESAVVGGGEDRDRLAQT